MREDKKLDLESLVRSFKKEFGETIEIGSKIAIDHSKFLKTSILTLDIAIGGGIPKGRIVEIYGQESSGKTTLSLILLREAQKYGFLTAFIDAEASLDVVWAKTLGVNLDEFLIVSPDSLEDALKKVEFLLKKDVNFIVFDSIPALPTVTEAHNEIGDANVAIKARVLSSSLAKLNPLIRDKEAIIVFINQIREKIGVYGNPETTPGGRALKFFSSLRINLRKKMIKSSDEFIGEEIIAKIEKNKIAPPGKEARFILYYDGRVSVDYASILSALDLAEKAGAWYTVFIPGIFEGKFHGKDQINEKIMDDDQLREKVEDYILNKINNPDLLEKITEEEESQEDAV